LKIERSLFFNHRSGSGGTVTPGTTPGGIRDFRTFFGFSREAVEGCCAEGKGPFAMGGAEVGGGAVSIALEMEAGKELMARK